MPNNHRAQRRRARLGLARPAVEPQPPPPLSLLAVLPGLMLPKCFQHCQHCHRAQRMRHKCGSTRLGDRKPEPAGLKSRE